VEFFFKAEAVDRDFDHALYLVKLELVIHCLLC